MFSEIAVLRVIGFISLLLLMAGCGKEKRMQPDEIKAIVHREIDEIWNKGNFAATDEIIANEYILHEAAEDVNGNEAFKAFAAEFHTAFPIARFRIDDVIIEGGKVVVRYTFKGKHGGNYLGVAPTGKEVTATGIRISRVADGKLGETWNYLDKLSILTQLGWWVPPEDWQLAYDWGEQTKRATEATSDLNRNKTLARRSLKELWDTGNLAIVDELYADSFTNHEVTHRQFHDSKSYKKYVTVIRRVLPDFRVVIEDMIAEGDEVAIRWNVGGTEKTSGGTYTWGGVTIFRFSDHEIVEAWWGRNALSVAQQMGITPELEN
jgi:steroid delta-isomerase-like uncharacterized protein